MSHDQSEQYQEFLMGNKALCVLEHRKDADTFHKALADTLNAGQYDIHAPHVHIWHSPEGLELVLVNDTRVLSDYMRIMHNPVMKREARQYELGLLFGYDHADVAQYVRDWSPDFCQCSKCVGVHAALEAKAGE